MFLFRFSFTRLLTQVLLFRCKFNVDRSLTCQTCTCPVFSSQHGGLRLKTFDLPSCLLYDPLVSSSRMCPLERILSCLSSSSLPHSRPASAAAAAWNELQRRRRCLSPPAATAHSPTDSSSAFKRLAIGQNFDQSSQQFTLNPVLENTCMPSSFSNWFIENCPSSERRAAACHQLSE